MGAESERMAGFGRMEDGLRQSGDWYRWGPYVSERQTAERKGGDHITVGPRSVVVLKNLRPQIAD